MSGSEDDYEEYQEEQRSSHSSHSSDSSHSSHSRRSSHNSHHSGDYEDGMNGSAGEYANQQYPSQNQESSFLPPSAGAAMFGALAGGLTGHGQGGNGGYDSRETTGYNQQGAYGAYGGQPQYPEQGGNGVGAGGYGGPAGYEGYPSQQGYPQGQGNYNQSGFGLPSGGPPPGQYQPTGAGFIPAQYNYVAPQPPWGHQSQGSPGTDASRGAQQYFEYSTCSGNKKALLIGINYFGTASELAGCINDVHNVQRFIVERFGYNPSDIVILTDDSRDSRSVPTKANILRAMGWLVDGAQKNDSLFFHYSGHGTQVEDVDGDEGDDDDEAICPVDYEEAGLIVDDDSGHDLLVKPLPAGCRLTAIFDSCHSGTVMDLPYVYSTEGKVKEPNLFEGVDEHLMGMGKSALSGDSGGLLKGLIGIAKGAFEAKQADTKVKKNNTSAADVIQWAGCKDSQTSADTQEEGKATGAMSYAFIAALTKYPNQSYQQLLVSVREEMKGKYTQKPQLSACHPIDTDLMFVA